ncbi:hypothetical protein GCM10029992_12230 [Glycomyces albus]
MRRANDRLHRRPDHAPQLPTVKEQPMPFHIVIRPETLADMMTDLATAPHCEDCTGGPAICAEGDEEWEIVQTHDTTCPALLELKRQGEATRDGTSGRQYLGLAHARIGQPRSTDRASSASGHEPGSRARTTKTHVGEPGRIDPSPKTREPEHGGRATRPKTYAGERSGHIEGDAAALLAASLGALLRALRADRGMSAYTLAKRAAVNRSTVWRLEAGQRRPRRSLLANLAYGLEPDAPTPIADALAAAAGPFLAEESLWSERMHRKRLWAAHRRALAATGGPRAPAGVAPARRQAVAAEDGRGHRRLARQRRDARADDRARGS